MAKTKRKPVYCKGCAYLAKLKIGRGKIRAVCIKDAGLIWSPLKELLDIKGLSLIEMANKTNSCKFKKSFNFKAYRNRRRIKRFHRKHK